MSAIDALFTYLRGTLQDPPAILLDAEREVMALRDQMRAMQQALDASGRNEFDGLGEQMTRAAAEEIAAQYSYWTRTGSLHGIPYIYARCDELRDEGVSLTDDDGVNAMRRLKEAAVDCVVGMLRDGKTPPPPAPRGDLRDLMARTAPLEPLDGPLATAESPRGKR